MDNLVPAILGLAAFFAVVFLAYFAITRGLRALFGPRRRLEEELSLGPLRARLRHGDISQEEFDQAKRALGL